MGHRSLFYVASLMSGLLLTASLVTLDALEARQGTQAARPASDIPKPWTNEDDHRNMMEQLGITALRPGPSGNESAPNHANTDEALANPFPNLPDVRG